ncbi:MAG: ADP-ribosyl-[dinitrogen reductase] hydrolase [Desulfuromonadaceae bacterium GWC2_58_13]|nr:MAG: ADP-ribosyl-[dinitrogen reductase] hydrolase [Desulfuromonadaceae bacterium GWC2_58_13]
MLTADEILSRGRAAFLGLAIGDALGATTEFMNPREIQARHKVHRKICGGGWLGLKPGCVTDDTEMSVAMARAIVDAGGWNLTGIADNFVAWMRGKPIDIGSTCRKGIRNYMLNGVTESPYNEWDAGNGGVMRMLPAALFTLDDDALMQRCVVEQARLTHNHPLSDSACITVGRMIQRAMTGANRFELHAITRELIDRHPNFQFNNYKGNASGYVVDTLQTVFHYLFTTASFEECLVGVVNQGGDADTTGAIAGMIAGAFYGPDAIPDRWSRKLDDAVRQEVLDLAERLVRLSPWGSLWQQ